MPLLDVAVIVLGVETRNASASAAVSENAALMNWTIQAVLRAGVNRSDVQTSQYSLATKTQNPPIPYSGASVISQNQTSIFVATNQVTIRTNHTGSVGKILDAAISAGSNNVVSISFDIRNPQPQTDEALRRSVIDARRMAEAMASAAGVRLGKAMEISGGYSFVAPRAVAYSMAAALNPTPFEEGQVQVTSAVSMTYQVLP
jgi:uncharacterized protein YggE